MENKTPSQNIQDVYLNTVRRDKAPVTVFLISGVKLIGKIKEKFGITPTSLNGTLRIEKQAGHSFISQVVDAFPEMIEGVNLSRPTLEDVFIARTGHRFWEEK